MKKKLVFILLFQILFSTNGYPQSKSKIYRTSGKFIYLISDQLKNSQNLINSININTMDIDYRNGKLVERMINVVNMNIKSTSIVLSALETKETLSGEYTLTNNLNSLISSMATLDHLVSNSSIPLRSSIVNIEQKLISILIEYQEMVSMNMKDADDFITYLKK